MAETVGFWNDPEWKHRDRNCGRCLGTGWIDVPGPYEFACPDCRPVAAGHAHAGVGHAARAEGSPEPEAQRQP
jgi:hypothetical protein